MPFNALFLAQTETISWWDWLAPYLIILLVIVGGFVLPILA